MQCSPGAKRGLDNIFENESKEDKLALLHDICVEAEQNFLRWNLPRPLVIDFKLIEHALCEFTKFCHYSWQAVKEPHNIKGSFESRQALDLHAVCMKCDHLAVFAFNVITLILKVMYICDDCETLFNKNKILWN